MDVDRLRDDLGRLGLEQGDTVLVRASVRALGIKGDPAKKLLEAFLNAVGERGTVFSLSYTPFTRVLFGPPPDDVVFHYGAPTYAGGFPQCMLEDPRSLRSLHPTSSVVAIGRNAARIVEGHDHLAPAYLPIQRLVEMRGKMVLIGCVASNPGFTTAHLAEQTIGMGWRYILPRANKCYFISDDGSKKIFKRPDPGFCSRSFNKFYGMYVAHQILRAGDVGSAYSIMAPAHPTYQIECATLLRQPRFNICDDPMCELCNSRRWDRLHYAILYSGRRFIRRFVRASQRRRH